MGGDDASGGARVVVDQCSEAEVQALRVVKLEENNEKQEAELKHLRQRINHQAKELVVLLRTLCACLCGGGVFVYL